MTNCGSLVLLLEEDPKDEDDDEEEDDPDEVDDAGFVLLADNDLRCDGDVELFSCSVKCGIEVARGDAVETDRENRDSEDDHKGRKLSRNHELPSCIETAILFRFLLEIAFSIVMLEYGFIVAIPRRVEV